MALIKVFSDGSILEYGRGRFDDWCVYLTRPNGIRYAPRDVQYFSRFKALAQTFGAQKIYNDFVQIYNRTTSELDDNILIFISELSQKYGHDCLEMDIWLTTTYAGMVAEERKANAILKKRIKRLGMHQLLLENMSPKEAANFSWGKKVSILSPECSRRGF